MLSAMKAAVAMGYPSGFRAARTTVQSVWQIVLWEGDWAGANRLIRVSLRCIFGNPFRPVTFDPSWLTSTVVSLARAIYDERAFDHLAVLADALEDAGCTNPRSWSTAGGWGRTRGGAGLWIA